MNEKRTLLAIAITALFLLTYPLLLEKAGIVKPPTVKPVTSVSPFPVPSTTKDPEWQLPSASRVQSIAQNWIRVSLTEASGTINQVELTRYREVATQQPLRFFWSSGIGLAWVQDQPGPIQDKKSIGLTSISEIEAMTQSRLASGLELTQRYQLRPDQPAIDLHLIWKNPTGQPITLRPTIYLAGEITDLTHATDSRLVEVNVWKKEGKQERRYAHKLGNHDKPTRFSGAVEWAGVKGKYFSILLAPVDETAEQLEALQTPSAHLQMAMILTPREIPSGGGQLQQQFVLYIGPNNSEVLAAAHPGFEKLVASGLMNTIGQILLSILNGIHGGVRNYGIAIVLLTLLVNLILFPLTVKSLASMKQMQKLQPKIQKIRDTYKDNPQKMNQETLALYQQHKINPLGGCFPMVLQMPVFIALYQTLVRSIELRGAEFLWIQDLSAPDAFWRLPWGIPFVGNTINLLPILMILAMLWQQQLSMKSTQGAVTQGDPQRIMATVMPVLFGVLFYHLPSGLVLYWLTNTLIMATYQFQLMRTA